MVDWKHRLAGLGLETAYFAGLARIAERKTAGHGLILGFRRVRPRANHGFQPLRADEITPSFLRRVLKALKTMNFDIVSVDEARDRMMRPAGVRRFAVLTFEGGYGDFKTYAHPVLQSYQIPFAVYIPTGFIDGIAFPWWLALEALVAQTPRIALVLNGVERRFKATSTGEKYLVFHALYGALRDLPPHEIAVAIRDVCARYHIDLQASVSGALMKWTDIAALATDPRAIVGSATVNYVTLAKLSDADAFREMKMGRSVLESILGRACPHFAYPFGEEGTFTGREMSFAEQLGFETAMSSRAGLLAPDGAMERFSLPRLAWNGRRSSTRVLRVHASGLMLPRRPQPKLLAAQ